MTNDGKCRPHQPVVDSPQFCLQLVAQSPPCCIIHNIPFKRFQYMTVLLHEGIFHVEGVLKPAIFGGMPRAHMMCNWAQILICWRH